LDACDLEVSFPLLFSLAHCLKKGVTVHWKEDLADAFEDCPQIQTFAQDNNIIQSPSKYLGFVYQGKSLHLPQEQYGTIDN
jgi:hypothetical protein